MGAIVSSRYSLVEPFFNKWMGITKSYSDAIADPKSTDAKAYSYSLNALTTFAAVPIELLAAIENAVKLPFIAITTLFWEMPLAIIGFTGNVLNMSPLDDFMYTMRKDVPGLRDLVFTAYKVVMFIVGACMTLAVGMLFSTTANEDFHRALELLDPVPVVPQAQTQTDPKVELELVNLLQNESLSEEVARLTTELEESKIRLAEEIANHQELLNKLSEATEKTNSAESALENANQRLRDLGVANQDLESKYLTLEGASNEQQQHATLNIAQLTKRVADLEAELDLAKNQLAAEKEALAKEQKARAEAEEAASQSAAREARLNKLLEEEVKAKKKMEDENQATLEAKNNLVDHLNKQIGGHIKEKEALNTQLEEQRAASALAVETTTRLGELVKSTDTEKKALQKELATLKQQAVQPESVTNGLGAAAVPKTPIPQASQPGTNRVTIDPEAVAVGSKTPNPLQIDRRKVKSAQQIRATSEHVVKDEKPSKN